MIIMPANYDIEVYLVAKFVFAAAATTANQCVQLTADTRVCCTVIFGPTIQILCGK